MLKQLSKNIGSLAIIIACLISANAQARVRTTSSIVVDIETGKILSAKNSETLMYPASLTKVMTLYITFDALEKGLIKKDDMLPVSYRAMNVSPSKLGLRRGEKISVEDAVHALIVKSANDCAVVLAEALGYSEQRFAEAMTDVAKELGMKNTTFKNASGLPNREQKTTAKDMAILAAAMYNHFPQYYDLFSLQSFKYKNITYRTHNRLLGRFAGADGLKTGYTAAAGYNIVTSAERKGKRIIAVTMGHNTLKERDRFIAQQMDSNLNKLAGIKAPKELLAEIEIVRKPIYDSKTDRILVLDEVKDQELDASENWGIFLGSFSNYTKAQNYAKKLKVKEKEKLADKTIEVEIEEVRAAIVYKPKIVGFSQEDAYKFCNNLKKNKKSCTVVAGKEIQLAYHNKQQ
ncbi:MAG: D-alanyl-D-alanine carboxypeptidase [Alphaproteobacteria bacterium]|nr:D-alanyl-D-alanine carboxypeptidase [Alphaproteobacteria bacterium]